MTRPRREAGSASSSAVVAALALGVVGLGWAKATIEPDPGPVERTVVVLTVEPDDEPGCRR